MVENFQRWKGMNQGANLVATTNNSNMAIWIIRAANKDNQQQFLEEQGLPHIRPRRSNMEGAHKRRDCPTP